MLLVVFGQTVGGEGSAWCFARIEKSDGDEKWIP